MSKRPFWLIPSIIILSLATLWICFIFYILASAFVVPTLFGDKPQIYQAKQVIGSDDFKQLHAEMLKGKDKNKKLVKEKVKRLGILEDSSGWGEIDYALESSFYNSMGAPNYYIIYKPHDPKHLKVLDKERSLYYFPFD